MKTAVADMLGIEYPILAFSHCRDVVAAVTNAGGFGVLGAVAHTPEQLEIDLTWIDEHVGGKPYGVDLLLPQKYEGADQGGLDRDALRQLLPAEQQAFVDDIMARYQVPQLDDEQREAVSRLGGMNVSPKGYEPLLDVAFDHPIKLIASALGPPPAALIERAHAAGVVVAALAGTKEHALRHQEIGVDIIVAQGTEGGGHTGEVATMVLVPEVVDAVAPTPVLAAGGIGNGRQVAAAMALGAQGIWCGSVWLTTEEAETQPVIKEKYLAARSKDTVRSRSITGKPARMLKTKWTEEWERPDGPGPLGMPLQPLLVSEAQARINRAANTPGSGAQELATYFVGQVVGQMNVSKKAGQVVLDMVEEYADVVLRFAEEAAETSA
ncbi:nitronate monooxygenase [Actinomarinicola tropica]|uniref:Nitronate monooxygenase n=1 Tax=Actinomarinicola tropica TaxID=2789776 RepID=A0A5Q2RB77_9ACTN|nr:nitronate monooxygenase family protein [Actinomarinicola tropica]QGG94078.1 nitronate monooxygenase [Actinomarinicola tropica]